MILVACGKKRFVGSLLVLLGCTGLSLLAENAPSVEQIISNAVARSQQAQTKPGSTAYSYTKFTLTEELDAEGKIKESKERLYHVVLQGNATSVKLISVDGHPPTEADLKKHAENELNARQLSGQSKSGKGDNRENFLTPELTARFDFKLQNQVVINGRPSYQITFAPKNPAPPIHHLADRLLDRFSGTVWIDAQEFEIAKAEVRLGSEINLLGGVVGCLKKMAYTVTRTRLAEGIWLNTSSSGDFEGRKLVDSLRIKTRSRSSNFRTVGLAS